jgi:hypothetical protein
MKNSFKILKTNWINVLGVFVTVFIYSFLKTYTTSTFTLYQTFFSTLILVCLYGVIFWIAFVIVLIILDVLLKIKSSNTLQKKLILEWILISAPFFYWVIKYEQWIFLVAIITFLITQILRKKLILKILNE